MVGSIDTHQSIADLGYNQMIFAEQSSNLTCRTILPDFVSTRRDYEDALSYEACEYHYLSASLCQYLQLAIGVHHSLIQLFSFVFDHPFRHFALGIHTYIQSFLIAFQCTSISHQVVINFSYRFQTLHDFLCIVRTRQSVLWVPNAKA